MPQTRRTFLRNSGVGLLTFYIGGCEVEMTPQEAREAEVAFRVLSDTEVATVDALGEILVPGAAGAGLSHFIDHQLAASPEESLLMIRYLGVNPPFAPFYQGGLAAVNALSQTQQGKPYAGLNRDQQTEILGQFAQSNPDGWDGPPGPFLYFVLRNDAVDVVYGTR
ncbi:MAG: gluconate 2-dehydrogenase subunit 3 family protein, partial [Woeseiaceae bacterium]|nr:gluconate 2-dehydrogenase subunit 3 family protein [Woeseiaceae bacterium]